MKSKTGIGRSKSFVIEMLRIIWYFSFKFLLCRKLNIWPLLDSLDTYLLTGFMYISYETVVRKDTLNTKTFITNMEFLLTSMNELLCIVIYGWKYYFSLVQRNVHRVYWTMSIITLSLPFATPCTSWLWCKVPKVAITTERNIYI
jgi:hypothetical protein